MANLNRIKVVLEEKGKTGKWLAEEIGKTPCTVSKWCSNSIQPDLQTLDKIAKLLDVDVKDLLNSTEKQKLNTMAKKAPKVEKEDLMMPQTIDIKEYYLLTEYPEALDLLLIDQTTHKNIFWASKSYEQLGDGYKFFDSITRKKITGENGNVIKPRAAKSKEEQTMRVKVNAEVFTPSWICNKQNNLVDQSWFGRKDVFNNPLCPNCK